jgi:hypothetical protein
MFQRGKRLDLALVVNVLRVFRHSFEPPNIGAIATVANPEINFLERTNDTPRARSSAVSLPLAKDRFGRKDVSASRFGEILCHE